MEEKKLEVVFQRKEVRDLWAKRMTSFSIREERFIWRLIPTMIDKDTCVGPVHLGEGKKHCIYLKKLGEALQNGFNMPHFMGGLEVACLL